MVLLLGCGRIGFEPQAASPADGTAGGACVSELAVAVDSACARLDDGSVWCWGLNNNGQLGNGTFVSATSPVAVGIPFAAP